MGFDRTNHAEPSIERQVRLPGASTQSRFVLPARPCTVSGSLCAYQCDGIATRRHSENACSVRVSEATVMNGRKTPRQQKFAFLRSSTHERIPVESPRTSRTTDSIQRATLHSCHAAAGAGSKAHSRLCTNFPSKQTSRETALWLEMHIWHDIAQKSYIPQTLRHVCALNKREGEVFVGGGVGGGQFELTGKLGPKAVQPPRYLSFKMHALRSNVVLQEISPTQRNARVQR